MHVIHFSRRITASYLINLSQAVGRLILTGRDLTRFAGYTSRVADLFEVLRDIREGKFSRTMVSNDGSEATQNMGKILQPSDIVVNISLRVSFCQLSIQMK